MYSFSAFAAYRPHTDILLFSWLQGTEAVEGILLDMSQTRDINFNPEVFQKMYNLRFLKIYNSPSGNGESNVCPYEELISFSDNLTYLQWDGFCPRFLPVNFSAENLVELIMPKSRVAKLWDGVQVYKCYFGFVLFIGVFCIDLSHSSHCLLCFIAASWKLEKD